MARSRPDIVAVAASAGGIHALGFLLETLPSNFPAAVVVVQHLDPKHRSLLADILGRKTRLAVRQACEDDKITPGVVLVAPPDRHLLVNPDGTVSLTQTELVHFVRPSADLLFESVAAGYQKRAVAVVLSGSGVDGAMGIRAIKKMGGTVIVQDPKTAEFSGMPEAAVLTEQADFIAGLESIPALVRSLVEGDTTDVGRR